MTAAEGDEGNPCAYPPRKCERCSYVMNSHEAFWYGALCGACERHQTAPPSHEGARTAPAEAASAPLASGDPKARDTLRGELEALAEKWGGVSQDTLRALIRKHYGAS